MNTIDAQIALLTQTRKNILDEVNACSNEQLFRIPDGFDNNIIWHVAHLMATMEILIYSSSNASSDLDPEIVEQFKKGTFPKGGLDQGFIDKVKGLFLEMLTKLKNDYEGRVFGDYISRTTSYGVTLNSVEDAIYFINSHESMHYGQIKMLRKLLA